MELKKIKIPEFSLLDSPLAGTNLIEANAGTGKTYAISKLFVRLILEEKASVDEILVVTFTDAATGELKERVRADLIAARETLVTGQAEDPFWEDLLSQFDSERSEILLRNSLRLFDDVSIFTIHGFCQRSLKDNTFESGSLFEMELITDQRELLEEIVDDFWRKNLYTASSDISSYLLERVKSADYFLKLFAKIPLTQKVTVLPKQKRILPEVLGNERARCLTIIEELREVWQGEKQNIQALLEGNALKATSYGKRVSPAVEEMDLWLRSKDTPLSLFKNFGLFTRDKIGSSLKKDALPPEHPFFATCDRFIEQFTLVEGLLESVLLCLEHDLLAFVKEELTTRKKERNLLFFDDLLIGLNNAVQNNEGNSHLAVKLRSLYKAVLIDEFQDTDTLQYSIFHTLFGRGEHILFLIGDPKQAIYRFRGADIFAYLSAVKDVENRYSLQTNYRSDGALINAVNSIFSHCEAPFLFEDIQYFSSRSSQKGEETKLVIKGDNFAPLKLCFLSRTDKNGARSLSKEAASDAIIPAMTTEILRLLNKAKKGEATVDRKPLIPSDIAILVRSHREAAKVKVSLDAKNVPSVVDSTENIFETEDVETITRLLQAIHDSGNIEKIAAIMTSDIIGYNATQLEELKTNESLLERWLIAFEKYHKLWHERGFIVMFRTFLTEEKVAQHLLGLPDGERRLTNLMHLGELLHRETISTGKGVTELLNWLTKQRSSRSTPEGYEIRLERDTNAVRIVTIHKSKGLEYPIVFCPFATPASRAQKKETVSIFHKAGEQIVALRPDLVHGAIESVEQELLAENIRLLYVALTRAKSRCYLVVGNINGYDTSALSYLLHHKGKGNFFLETANKVKKMGDEELLQDMQCLIESSEETIENYDLFQERFELPYSQEETQEMLRCREFTGEVNSAWRISSFTSLLADVPANIELPDHDDGEEIEDDLGNIELLIPVKTKTIFDFPAGTKAGLFFHDLLENLDFMEEDEQQIARLVVKKLDEHGFESEWEETITENIQNLLKTPLLETDNSLTFSSISPQKCLNELEFYYPLSKGIKTRGLQEVSKQAGLKTSEKGINVAGLIYSPQEGFMKGFIDLVFQHGERYYLVDWKSNLLGKNLKAYHQENLKKSMVKKRYTLQYHIYTAALHRYLQYRVPNYCYNNNFGGVFYIYTRGINPNAGSSYGIFYDKPPLDVIEKML